MALKDGADALDAVYQRVDVDVNPKVDDGGHKTYNKLILFTYSKMEQPQPKFQKGDLVHYQRKYWLIDGVDLEKGEYIINSYKYESTGYNLDKDVYTMEFRPKIYDLDRYNGGADCKSGPCLKQQPIYKVLKQRLELRDMIIEFLKNGYLNKDYVTTSPENENEKRFLLRRANFTKEENEKYFKLLQEEVDNINSSFEKKYDYYKEYFPEYFPENLSGGLKGRRRRSTKRRRLPKSRRRRPQSRRRQI